ncbi:putative acetyltransferase [Methylocella tundrae]|uniref:Putative acetyltransferase n=1 Tax=Methylocella tundrae TaxID=227605 RepID=A0A8B6M2J4_METTU|nr:GNAT family N-acetyltransferase [Methylocella tundrae]VTZ27781.1 putative acetyltransferase [Methylocella tundrae]VTZ49004.1 putative acetyltransferase [Methylocella tundrae]
MNASAAFPKPTLRPYLAADLPLLSEIRLSAIEELTEEDYDEAQRRAWAELADDEEALGEALKKGLSLVGLVGGAPVGFIVLTEGGLISQLYVHPAVARTGVATALVDAIEKLAAARKIESLVVDASDTAKPLFDKRGYVAERRNTIALGDVWLGNTRMKKKLSP